jgi:hypothetical protein
LIFFGNDCKSSKHTLWKTSIVIAVVGEVKICVAAEEALKKKERQHHGTQFPTKIGGKN